MAETAQVAREGYRQVSTRENALFNMLASFAATLPGGRLDHLRACASGRASGPFRNVRVGRRHIHHFVPGIVLAFVAGRGGDPHPRARSSSRSSRCRSASGWG